MNLDELISKYIDGELSQEEDFILRKTLKDNPQLREDFDDYIDIHHCLQEDKFSIKVPAHLYRRTEEAVLGRIFANAPVIKANRTNVNRRFSFQLLSMVAMIPLLVLISIFNIGDGHLGSYFDNFSSDNSIESQESTTIMVDKSTILSKNVVKNENLNKYTTEQKQISQAGDNKIIELAHSIYINEDIDLINYSLIELEQKLALSNDIILHKEKNEGLNNNIDLSNNYSDESNQVNIINDEISTINSYKTSLNDNIELNNMLESHNPISNIVLPKGQITAIQLTTSISQDFVRTGISTSGNSSIFSMSQSLGYNINDDEAFGIEFGVMEMQYDYRKFIQLDANQSSSLAFVVNTPIESAGSPRIYLPVSLENSHQVIWGLAFYNTKLFDYGNLSLIGRIGLGATDDGPLATSRLVAKYKLFEGVVLSAGLEGKMFVLKTPLLNKLLSTISSFGLVYGLQFNI